MVINLKRKHIILWSILLLTGIASIFFMYFKINKIQYGKKIILEDNTLNIKSYYAEYDATVISNKNINTYFVKEWYKEGVGSKIEYLEYIKNVVTIITTPTDCYISNAGNKAYILTKNVYGTNNVLSLATYISIFNNITNCGCTKNVYEKDGEIIIVIEVCNKDNCEQSEAIKKLDITSFELRVIDNKPNIYTVYTGNKKEYASIVYNKFDTDTKILDDVFNIAR